MPEIVKAYRQHMPALRLIGKRYTDADRDPDGSFGSKWNEWFRGGWFGPLEALGPLPENEGAYLGCMTVAGGFAYWIGMFFPEGAPVPEGYGHADIPEGDVGVCWLRGRPDNGDVFGQKARDMCVARILEEGWQFEECFETSRWPWCFERYQCPRYTAPDETGNVILDYGIYIKPEPRGGKAEVSPEAEALASALHRAALSHGCAFRTDEDAWGRTVTYSARNFTVRVNKDEVSFSGDYDIRAFLKLFRGSEDDAVRRLLFEAATPCCYCIDDKCTTLLMAGERTIRYNGGAKKLCGPYRHRLGIRVTREDLPACVRIADMMFEYTAPHMHRDVTVVPNDVTYAMADKGPFYILGYRQRHSPVSPKDGEFAASLLQRDGHGRRRIDAVLEAAGQAGAERFAGATDNFVNGSSYDFIFGVMTDTKPAAVPEGAVCRKVRGGSWAVYNSSAGDYKSIWLHFTERFYAQERQGYDGSRIPFEFYDASGQFSDVHIPVDADLPADSGQVLQALHTSNELLAGFFNYAEADYPLYRDRPFDALTRIRAQFPHAQCLVRVSVHSLFGKPLVGFDGVPVDDTSAIPPDFETYELKGGYWRRLGYKHFNGGYQGWGEAIEGHVENAVPMFTMNHPRGFNEYVYESRGGYSEIGVPMRLLGKRSYELISLAPIRLAGKREAPPESVVTGEDIQRFFGMPENVEKGSYYIAYTLVSIKTPANPEGGSFFDKPFVQGVRIAEGTAAPEGLEAFTAGGGLYVKVTEDIPNGVLGWELGDILAGVAKETGRAHDDTRPFIYHQLDYGKRYILYVPVR